MILANLKEVHMKVIHPLIRVHLHPQEEEQEEQQEEQTGAKDADGERAEEEEDVTYEIRVVYVTDSTIGLRTTWPDG